MKESLLKVKLPSPRGAHASITIRRHAFPMELVHLNKDEVKDLDKAQGGAKFKGGYRDYTELGYKFMDGKFVNALNKDIRHLHANGGMAKLEKMRKSGRHGDTELAYMPKHVADRMDRMIGGACHNPHTGKREYFFGDLMKSIGNASASAPAAGAAAPAAAAPAAGGGWMSALGPLIGAGMSAFGAYNQPGGDWRKALAAGAANGAGSLLNQYGGQNGQMINNMIQQGNQAYQSGQGLKGAAQQAGMAGVNGVADKLGNMGGMAGMAGNMLRNGANAYQNGQGLYGAAQQAGMSGVNGALNGLSGMGGMAGMFGNAAQGAVNGYMQPGGNTQQALSGAVSGAMRPQQPQQQFQQTAASKSPAQQQPLQRPQQQGSKPQQQQQQQQQPQFSPQQMQQFMQYMMQQQQPLAGGMDNPSSYAPGSYSYS